MKALKRKIQKSLFDILRFKRLSHVSLFLIISCFSSLTVIAQETITVTGVVSDNNGVPLPGVTISQKETSNGDATNFEGEYSIDVPSNSILVFTYIGMSKKEINIGNRTKIDVVLEESATGLGEVLVVGFGTQSRELVTSAISKIKSEEIQNSPAVHPVQALQGKVAGLSINVDSGQPGTGAAVYIRGGTQANPRDGANEPLYVIDGVFREDLIGINSSDIASIEVLKDAASTAIYGARAANGVIVVTTKSGKGADGGNLELRYSTGIDTRLNNYNWTSAEDYIQVSRLAAQKGTNLNNPGARLSNSNFGYSVQNLQEKGEFGSERIALTYLDDLISLEGQTYVDDLLSNGYHTMEDPVTGRNLIFLDNQLDDIRTRTGISHDINVGASGASEMGYYNLSAGYLKNEGTLVGTGADRYNILMNGTFNVKDNLKVNGQFTYQAQNIDQVRSGNNTINRSSRLPHTYRVWNDDGTPALGESTSSPRNIFHELYYQEDERKTFRNSYRIGVDWEIIKGLSFRPSASVYRLENIVNLFEKASPEKTDRAMFRSHDTENQIMFDGLLSYKKNFAEKHNIDALLGTQYVYNRFEDFEGSGANAPTDIIITINGSETDRERASSFIRNEKLLSFFGRLNYDFDKKYLLGFTIRRDGSSNFAENNRWAVFPSVSAGWNVHREDFWKSNFIDRFKLRGSWGRAGNDNINVSDARGSFATTSYGLNGAVVINRLPNRNLIWETTTQTDIGFDMSFLENRLNLTVDLYDKETSDRLIDKPLPNQFGFSSIRSNYGSINNSGLEIEAGGRVLEKGKFSWDAYMNWGFNKSRITKLPNNNNDKNRIGGFNVWDENGNEVLAGGLAEGERPNGIWVYDMIGVYSTDEEAAGAPDDLEMSGFYRSEYGGAKKGGDAIWRDVNGDNIIDSRDRVRIGYRDPNIRGGFSNTFTYGGLSLRVVMDWALGHTIDNNWRARSNGNARNNVMTLTDVLSDDIWKEQGDLASIPRYDNASDFDNGPKNHVRASSLYHQKGDYLAFREVSLSYQLPNSLLEKFGMNQTTIGLESYNLGYITGYDGLTPEIFDGVDEGIYPRPFQVRLRLTTNF